jgi:hypothetical protein
MMPGHGPIATKRAVPGQRPNGPYRAGPAQNPDKLSYIYLFSINFVFLIKNLFNIIKFELKIYDFTLNNVIKNSLYHFFAGSCRAMPG